MKLAKVYAVFYLATLSHSLVSSDTTTEEAVDGYETVDLDTLNVEDWMRLMQNGTNTTNTTAPSLAPTPAPTPCPETFDCENVKKRKPCNSAKYCEWEGAKKCCKSTLPGKPPLKECRGRTIRDCRRQSCCRWIKSKRAGFNCNPSICKWPTGPNGCIILPTEAPTMAPTTAAPTTTAPTKAPTKAPVRVRPPAKQCRGKTIRQCRRATCCKFVRTRPAGKQCVVMKSCTSSA